MFAAVHLRNCMFVHFPTWFKVIAFVIVAMITAGRACGQSLGIDMNRVMPSGAYTTVFKPAAGIEGGYAGDVEKRISTSLALGYYRLKTQRDTFHSTAWMHVGNTSIELKSFEVFENYKVVSIAIYTDGKITDTRLTPTIGVGVAGYMISYFYSHHVETLIDATEHASIGAVALIPRMGLLYKLNDSFLLNSNFGRSMALQSDYGTQAYWKAGLGAHYSF